MKNSNLKNFYSLLAFTFFILLLIASATTKQLSPLKVPTYDYTVENFASPGSTDIKIAFIEPEFDGNFLYSESSPFTQFRKSMSLDMEEILTSKGFIVKGPYEVYDMMTFSDKKECELGLEVKIDLNIAQTSGGWGKTVAGPRSDGSAEFAGTLNLSGKITISIIETLTRQKLIVKSVPVPQKDIVVKTEDTYPVNQTKIPISDPGIHNEIANSLLDFYSTTMQRAYELLTEDELSFVKKQVPEIRANAGFIKR